MDNLKSNIPTREVKLSTGETVHLYTYLTIGESRQLQKTLLAGGKLDLKEGQLEEVSPALYMDMQDQALTFLVKNITKAEEVKPFSMDWLNSLSIEDGNKVYDVVNDVVQSSQMAGDEKKG